LATSSIAEDGLSHLLSEDCKTALSEWRTVKSEESLLGMIAKMRGEVTRAKNDIRRWNGSWGWVEALDGPVWFFGILSRRCGAEGAQSCAWRAGLNPSHFYKLCIGSFGNLVVSVLGDSGAICCLIRS
jgi:hypothetical protein